MANWSSTAIELTGTKEDIAEATKDIKSNIEGLWLNTSKLATTDSIDDKAGFSAAEIIQESYEDDCIFLNLSGRWCSPSKYFIMLADKYNLSGYYEDEECGCNFFHQIIFKDGKVESNKQDSYFSQLAIDSNGIERYLEDYCWLPEEEDWENNNDEILALFEKNGYPLEELKKEWNVK
jgi:hypothetical protein